MVVSPSHRVRLKDGSEVEIRPIEPADAQSLEEGLEALGLESRYRRFLTPKRSFSGKELAYLTNVDHHRHEALVALEPGEGRGLAVARFVKDPDDPRTAEVAIVVADEWQDRGLGRALLERLVGRAAEEGVQRFSATVLESNHDVVALLHKVGPVEHLRGDSGVIDLRVELPDAGPRSPVLEEALRAAARGDLALSHRRPPTRSRMETDRPQPHEPDLEAQRRAAAFLADAELFLGVPDDDVKAVYDRAADRYDHFRKLWLHLAGAGAERAMLADLRAVLRPGAKVLDAGCGTGVLARAMLEVEPDLELTLLDLSAAMLAKAGDVPGAHLQGNVLELPFPDGVFDVVVSSWVIETVPDPMRAVTEYLRVLDPDGHVFYTFCSLPHGWFSRTGSAWLRHTVGRDFAGDFLDDECTPWHDCDRSHLHRFGHGLATEVALRRCCSVGAQVLPGADPPSRPADGRTVPSP